MRKSLVTVILASLLIGIIASVATIRIKGPNNSLSENNCGFSISSTTGKRTNLKYCLQYHYGWPVKYANSGVDAILRDYHTIVPGSPADAGSIISYASFSSLRFVADWAIWSVAAYIVILIGEVKYKFLTKSKPKKHRSK